MNVIDLFTDEQLLSLSAAIPKLSTEQTESVIHDLLLALFAYRKRVSALEAENTALRNEHCIAW